MFAGCAICAAIGLISDDPSAQTASGIKRTVTGRTEGPAEGYETLQVIVDIEPNVVLDWHTHPGTEAGYTLDGTGELRVRGEPARTMTPGFSWVTAPGTPHMLKNGATATRLLVTFTVQKGKPLATPVPAPT
ncbi:hypothetical protein A5481_19590 [Methylobacterium platani]|uniref:Cupin type-2 domain-containing protein n=2 Tax=Methylobacterium platani TaxID=427683 RepID=A0A179S5X0_9HYPH|nr:hypothetical protein A5481_19590 [Methylobacterium platani]